MTTTVRQWTGLEAKALRAALRMTMREFAGYLGVAARTIAKWEARGGDIQPLPETQAILDTALAKASSDVQARFGAAVSDLLAIRTTAADTVSHPSERRVDTDVPTFSSAPILQSGILLPVVVDGRQILLPLDAAVVAGRGLALAMNLAPSLGDPSKLEAKPANVERAYELYLRSQGLLATNEKQVSKLPRPCWTVPSASIHASPEPKPLVVMPSGGSTSPGGGPIGRPWSERSATST